VVYWCLYKILKEYIWIISIFFKYISIFIMVFSREFFNKIQVVLSFFYLKFIMFVILPINIINIINVSYHFFVFLLIVLYYPLFFYYIVYHLLTYSLLFINFNLVLSLKKAVNGELGFSVWILNFNYET